jgi:chemotaxis regulatin CheY-phosphate phosphatase CheZ
VPSIVSLIDTLTGWADRVNQAAQVSSLSAGDQERLAGALQGALAALGDLKTAQEQTAALLADQRYGARYRLETCQQMREQAAQKATAALDALRAVADEVYATVSSAWQPKRPAGVDSVSLVDRKQDVQALLTSDGDDPMAILRAAAELLSEALLASAGGDTDSQLTAFVIASGPLDLFYRAHGITPEMTAAQFASTIGRQVSADGAVLQGAELAPLLGQGSATLQGFIQGCKSEIARMTEGMRDIYNQYIVILSGQLQ